MKSIAFFNFRYLPWSETFHYELVRNINDLKVVFICRTKENLDRFPFQNIECMSDLSPFKFLYNAIFLKVFKSCPFFEDVVRKHDIKILNACFGDRGPYLIKLKKKFNLPLVTFFYGDYATSTPKKNPHVYDELFNVGDIFLVCGKTIIKNLVGFGCPRKKIRLLYTGIDFNKFKFRIRKLGKDRTVKLVSVGRFVEKKGFVYLIEAFAKLKRMNPSIDLSIIGDGPLKNRLEKKIKELGLGNSIHFIGNLPSEDLPKELLKHHIFISPVVTVSNGARDIIPNTLVEAQASGMPVVSTSLPGNSEAVIDGKTGFLVSEKNVDALVEKTCFLISNPHLWPQMGKFGREHVRKNFDITRQAKKLEKICDMLLVQYSSDKIKRKTDVKSRK